MQLFTSRYQDPSLAERPDLLKVGVTLGNPRFPLSYPLADNVKLLAPSGALFKMTDPAEFIPAYRARLNGHGLEKIKGALEGIALKHDADQLVLLCFEDCSVTNGRLVNWCHRLVFARWWGEQTGETVLELAHETLPDRGAEALEAFFGGHALYNEIEQLSLF